MQIIDINLSELSQEQRKEELIEIVNQEIKLYQRNKKAKNSEAEKLFKTHIIEEVSKFTIKGENPKSIVIDEDTSQFIQRHVDQLIQHVNKENSKSFISKWATKILNYIQGKKQILDDKIIGEAFEITKRLEDKVKSDPQNIVIFSAEKQIDNGKRIIAEMKEYDLLDNLSDLKKLESLDYNNLQTLYKLAMTDPMLNSCSGDLSLSNMDKELNKKTDDNHQISKKIMLSNLEKMLNTRDNKLPSPEELNVVKASRSIRMLSILDDNRKVFLKGKILNPKLEEKVSSTMSKVKELQDHYILSAIIKNFIIDLDKNKDKIFLLNIYKKVGYKDPQKELENDLLTQCKQIEGLADKLNTYDKVEDFKARLLEQLKKDKISGHIKAIIDSPISNAIASSRKISTSIKNRAQ